LGFGQSIQLKKLCVTFVPRLKGAHCPKV